MLIIPFGTNFSEIKTQHTSYKKYSWQVYITDAHNPATNQHSNMSAKYAIKSEKANFTKHNIQRNQLHWASMWH